MKNEQKKPNIILLMIALFLNFGLQVGAFFVFETSSAFYLYLLIAVLANILLFTQIILIINTKSQKKPRTLDFEAIINLTGEAMILVDSENRISLFNSAAELLTGHRKEDVIGIDYEVFLKITDYNGAPIAPELDPIQNSIKINELIKTREYAIINKSNQHIPVSISVLPINNDNHAALVTLHDISKELEKEREQMEFISTASHEMRTPIAAIEGYLGLALNPKTATVDQRATAYISKAKVSVGRLGTLFKNLLSISKAEDNRLKMNPSLINLEEFITDLTDDFQAQAERKGLKIAFAQDKRSKKMINPRITVYLDKTVLYEIISNLVENAIKYTKEGTVLIELGLDQQSNALISVKDTGPGISAEHIPHLFQKFYRVDSTATREVGGTGLGLYLARKLAENVKGKIWVESVVDQGTTFYISLPRTTAKEAQKLEHQNSLTANPN